MNEYGFKETWTKQLSIGALLEWSFVGCGKNEELFFADSSTMYLYDLRKRKPPHDIIYSYPMGKNFVPPIEVVNHIDSLVTIEGTKVFVKRSKNSWSGGDYIIIFIFFIVLLVHVLALGRSILFII